MIVTERLVRRVVIKQNLFAEGWSNNFSSTREQEGTQMRSKITGIFIVIPNNSFWQPRWSISAEVDTNPQTCPK